MDDDHVLWEALNEYEATSDGRPSVYTRPVNPRMSNVAGRPRDSLPYKDRLLLALRRAHGRPRYDVPPELN